MSETITQSIREGPFDRLTAEEKIIRSTAFHAIFHGKPLRVDEIAVLTDLDLPLVQESVASLVNRGLIVTGNSGTILGSHGLSLIPTNHHLHINGRNLFTWCALDAIGIPVALQADALIESTCHHCRTPIQIEVITGKVSHTSHPDIRIWIVSRNLEQSLVGNT